MDLKIIHEELEELLDGLSELETENALDDKTLAPLAELLGEYLTSVQETLEKNDPDITDNDITSLQIRLKTLYEEHIEDKLSTESTDSPSLNEFIIPTSSSNILGSETSDIDKASFAENELTVSMENAKHNLKYLSIKYPALLKSQHPELIVLQKILTRVFDFFKEMQADLKKNALIGQSVSQTLSSYNGITERLVGVIDPLAMHEQALVTGQQTAPAKPLLRCMEVAALAREMNHILSNWHDRTAESNASPSNNDVKAMENLHRQITFLNDANGMGLSKDNWDEKIKDCQQIMSELGDRGGKESPFNGPPQASPELRSLSESAQQLLVSLQLQEVNQRPNFAQMRDLLTVEHNALTLEREFRRHILNTSTKELERLLAFNNAVQKEVKNILRESLKRKEISIEEKELIKKRFSELKSFDDIPFKPWKGEDSLIGATEVLHRKDADAYFLKFKKGNNPAELVFVTGEAVRKYLKLTDDRVENMSHEWDKKQQKTATRSRSPSPKR